MTGTIFSLNNGVFNVYMVQNDIFVMGANAVCRSLKRIKTSNKINVNDDVMTRHDE